MGDGNAYTFESWHVGGEDLSELQRLKYRVLVEEMGKYRAAADHEARTFVEDEDERSQHYVARAADGTLVAAMRLTRGDRGLSDRQIDQYRLRPWLDAGLADVMAVGERAMVAPEHRGTPVFHEMMDRAQASDTIDDIRVIFSACEPHLLSMYIANGQSPYADKNINSVEAGYLIPMVSFRPDVEALRGLGVADAGELPAPAAAVVSGRGAVTSGMMAAPQDYLAEIRDTLDQLAATEIGAFDDFTEDEIQRCLGRSNIIECAAGDRVLKAGGAGRNIFVVLAGTLEVRVDDRPVGVLQTGDAFGETAFLLDMTRTADIVAVVPDSRILSLSDGALRKMIEEEPTIAAKFLLNLSKMLCGRLIKAN